MGFFEAIKVALQSLWANKMRTVLTTIGVTISVSSVIAVITLSNGAKMFVVKKILSHGSDTLTVTRLPADALPQEPDQRLRAGDESLNALGVISGVGVSGEVAQLLPRGGEDSCAGLLNHGAIEDPEAHAARELADRRVPHLGGHDKSVERLVKLVAQRLRQRLGMLEALVQERHYGENL